MTSFRNTSDSDFPEQRSIVLNGLLARGWELSAGSAIACKQYLTEVGLKQAFVYLQDYPDSFVLQGDYQSEGRNSLEPHGVIIPKTSTDAVVAGYAIHFAVQADVVISQTYAAKLLGSASAPGTPG